MTDTVLADDFDAIAPQGRGATVHGTPIKVTPLTVGQIPAVMRALRGVDLARFSAGDLDALGELLADHGDGVITAIAVAARQPEEVVAGLDLEEFLALLTVVVEVNADFFARRVAPAMKLTLARLKRNPLSPGRGPTRFNS